MTSIELLEEIEELLLELLLDDGLMPFLGNSRRSKVERLSEEIRREILAQKEESETFYN